MSPKIAWLSFNTCLATCLIGGFIYDIAGLRNVGLFIIWSIFAISLLTVLPDVREELIKRQAQDTDKRTGFPPFIRNVVILAIIIFLVWFGALWTAMAYIAAVVILKGLKAAVQELRNKSAGETPEFFL